MTWNKTKDTVIISLLSAGIIGGITVAYAHESSIAKNEVGIKANKEAIEKVDSSLERRLDRIEDKLDRLIEAN